MERNVRLDEISDGKLYGINDMVKADCGSCAGCSACCRGMGASIVLDPFDIYRLLMGMGLSFGRLMTDRIELNVADGIILPNLKMSGDGESCSFLNSGGRCSIHPYRPGFCRLFPLGRLYENRSFRYFLQIHECRKEGRTKVKVRKWLDTPDIREYEKFVADWHYFLKDVEQGIRANGDQESTKRMNMYLLNYFYITPYERDEDFYTQFRRRLKEAAVFAGEEGIEVVPPLIDDNVADGGNEFSNTL